MIYNKKTIIDYINGNLLDKEYIEKLENNFSFMKEVFDITNDKKMYLLCSNELKGNFELVTYLIKKFNYDISYIKDIFKNYMEFSQDSSDEKIEVNMMLYSFLPQEEKDFCNCLDIFSFYEYYKAKIECALNDEENRSERDVLGMGFIFIQDKFQGYIYTIEYFAKKFINEIFYENDLTLEELIHKTYKNKETINKQGINNFLISYIGTLDVFLSSYISTHLYLLDDIKKHINRIIKNWDFYITNLNENRALLIEDEINKFINSDIYDWTFNCYSLTNKLLSKYNTNLILDEENIFIEQKENPKIISFSKIMFIDKMKKLLEKLYSEDIIKESEIYEERMSITNGKLIKLIKSPQNK